MHVLTNQTFQTRPDQTLFKLTSCTKCSALCLLKLVDFNTVYGYF